MKNNLTGEVGGKRRVRWHPWLLALIAAVGCGGAREELSPTAPVSGTVVYSGNSISNGTVSFYPESGERSAGGVIGEDASFTLSTYTDGDGAVVGHHEVVVTSMKSSPDGSVGAGTSTDNNAIPAKYADRLTTPLTFKVKQGENNFEIVLED